MTCPDAVFACTRSPSAPPVDMAKVEEVRAAIAEGRFHIDTQGIADSVTQSIRELMSRG